VDVPDTPRGPFPYLATTAGAVVVDAGAIAPAGAAGGDAAGADAGAAGAGAGAVPDEGAGPEAVMGVTVTPITSPLTVSFFFLPTVPRATRVAFAVAARRCSGGNGVRALGACKPKSPSCDFALLNVARRKVT
jgi:hypothetical protein